MEAATRRQLAGITGLAGVAFLAGTTFAPETVVSTLQGLTSRPLLFLAVLGLVYLARPFLLWPVTSIALALGFLYDPILALPLSLAGAALTAMPPFLIGRYARSDAGIFGYLRASGQHLVGTVGEFRGVLAARFSPVPGDAISCGAGLSDVSMGAFLAGTVLGEIPWAAVAIITGASMRTLSLAEFSLDPGFFLALTGLALIVLAGPAYEHVRGTSVPDQ